MVTLTVLASPREDESLQPLPWRRMAWVTWRQHRAALLGVATFLAVLALTIWIIGVHLHHVYGEAIACRPLSSFTCTSLVSSFNGTGNFLANGGIVQLVPVLIGAFLGAPILAREMESGTFRYAWTQGFERSRWVLAKLVSLAVLVTIATGALSVLVSWYYQPYFNAINQSRSLTELSRFFPGLFDVRQVTLPAWTLAAFAIGALAGMVIRRVVPAIVATLAVYAGLALGVALIVRERYVAPVVTSTLNLFSRGWVLNRQWTKSGHAVQPSVLNAVLQRGGPVYAGKGGVPQSIGTWHFLARHGFTQLTTYQPSSRFWSFQLIEAGWLLVLSAVLLAVTVWLVKKKLA